MRSLLGTVDCNVQVLVHDGYATLFAANGQFASLLTVLLTVYVAFLGYRLMLGQLRLQVSDLALTLVKIGAILALSTQWSTYQALVYDLLFRGPQQLAGAMLNGVQAPGSLFSGDVFDGLQRAFDALSASAGDYGQKAPAQVSPLPGAIAMGAFSLTAAAGLLLLSSLGVLLVAKLVLGLLLAVGPLFIALFLFDNTRGLFEGWLRASLACALAPLSITLLTGVALTMLEPSIQQLIAARARGVYEVAPTYSVMILVLVFAGVALGALIAGGLLATGLRLPGPRRAGVDGGAGAAAAATAEAPFASQPRAVRVAAAAAAAERRDALTFGAGRGADVQMVLSDRRVSGAAAADRGAAAAAPAETRLGQRPRRRAQPHAARTTP